MSSSARLQLPKPNFSVYLGLGSLLALYPEGAIDPLRSDRLVKHK